MTARQDIEDLGHKRTLRFQGVVSAVVGALVLISAASSVSAQPAPGSCARADAMEEGAFDRPMTFSEATSKGNSGVSFWVAATGQIGPETPAKFQEFLDTNGIAGG